MYIYVKEYSKNLQDVNYLIIPLEAINYEF